MNTVVWIGLIMFSPILVGWIGALFVEYWEHKERLEKIKKDSKGFCLLDFICTIMVTLALASISYGIYELMRKDAIARANCGYKFPDKQCCQFCKTRGGILDGPFRNRASNYTCICNNGQATKIKIEFIESENLDSCERK